MVINELMEYWRRGGIATGDTLLIHSSLRRTLNQFKERRLVLSPAGVLESLQKAVGDNGTLLFPLFNFDFTKGVSFDIRTTPSQMGALTELARIHPKATRTGHPIYSFAALGRHANAFRRVDNQSGYGSDSAFALLRELDGRVGALNLSDQNSITFYHHVEEMMNVPYRYHKVFTGPYTDANGTTSQRSYSLFVRDLNKGILTDVNRMGDRLWSTGLYQGHRHDHETGFRSIRARDLYSATAEVISSGKALDFLYSIEQRQQVDTPLARSATQV